MRTAKTNKSEEMFSALLSIAALTVGIQAATSDGIIPNEYIVQMPVMNSAAAVDSSFEPAAMANMVSAYSTRFQAQGIKVLGVTKSSRQDTLLVQANSTALRSFSALGATITPNRVIKAYGFSQDAPWGLTVRSFPTSSPI